jgi:eukaryotic-like serine/threonine-protein kinase
MMAPSDALASRLLDKKIGKWLVTEKRIKTPEDDSGDFSSCYHVVGDDGVDGFLKAFNYQYAFEAVGIQSVEAMKLMVDRFTYEKELLEFCRALKIRRVVTAIDAGEYREPGEMPVPFLVFETATGSLKSLDLVQKASLTWKLLAFHGVLTGVAQLHWNKIAHQDLKPSNILVFGGDYVKVADLGSAVRQDDAYMPVGLGPDHRHAPLELLYGHLSSDWNTRRYGADLFMLGGLLSFMVSGTNVLSLVLSRLPPELHWTVYGGSFEQILPNIMTAFHEAVSVISSSIHDAVRDDLTSVIYELSYPVPEKRGNPPRATQSYSQFSLVRYISTIHRLALKTAFVGK